MDNNNQNTDLKFDMLREIGSIGTGNATTALSVLLNSSLKIEVPVVDVVEFNDLYDMVGGAENLVAAVITHFEGEANGMLIFILPFEEAKNMANRMLHQAKSDSMEFDEMEASALCEIGNILMSSYMASIEALTNMEMRTKIPHVCIDMAGSILSVPMIELGRIGDHALIVNSKFSENDRQINGFILMISDENSYDRIFQKLGIG